GSVTVTLRLLLRRRTAATAAAQAAEPQALVSPAPRSQVRTMMCWRDATWQSEMLARSGKIGWFSSSGPIFERSYAFTSLTQKIACGLPMLKVEGECRI